MKTPTIPLSSTAALLAFAFCSSLPAQNAEDTSRAADARQPAAVATEKPGAAQSASPQSNPSPDANTETRAQPQPAEPAQQSARASQPSRPSAAMQTASASSAATGKEMIQPAPEDMKDRTDRALAGRTVRGSDGEDLGTVKEFLIEPQSGKVGFAIVGSGGIAGVGDKNYLVPFKALEPGENDSFTVAITKMEWEQLTPVKDDDLEQPRFTMSDGERRQLAQRFQVADANGSRESAYTANLSAHFVRSSKIRGEDVHSGHRELGTIESLLIDQEKGTATAIFDAKKDFIGTSLGGKFMVPLDRFSFADTQGADVTTGLTRSDFEFDRTAQPGSTAGEQRTSVATATLAPENTSTEQSRIASGSSAGRTEESQSSTPAESADKSTTRSDTTSVASATAPTTSSASQAEQKPSPVGPESSDAKRSESSVASSAPSSASSQSIAKDDTTRSDTTSETSTAEQAQLAAGRTSSGQTGTIAPQTPTSEPQLSPTGKTSAEQTPAGDPALVSAAQAVRHAFDDDPFLAQLDVRVTPQDGKLLLRGKVNDESTKKSVEQKAEAAAQGHPIESQLSIENKNR